MYFATQFANRLREAQRPRHILWRSLFGCFIMSNIEASGVCLTLGVAEVRPAVRGHSLLAYQKSIIRTIYLLQVTRHSNS